MGMDDLGGFAHGGSHDFSEVIDRVRNVGADVENLIACRGYIYRGGDNGSHVTYMGESAQLLAISKNSHGFVLHELIHEDAYDVAVAVTNVLRSEEHTSELQSPDH